MVSGNPLVDCWKRWAEPETGQRGQGAGQLRERRLHPLDHATCFSAADVSGLSVFCKLVILIFIVWSAPQRLGAWRHPYRVRCTATGCKSCGRGCRRQPDATSPYDLNTVAGIPPSCCKAPSDTLDTRKVQTTRERTVSHRGHHPHRAVISIADRLRDDSESCCSKCGSHTEQPHSGTCSPHRTPRGPHPRPTRSKFLIPQDPQRFPGMLKFDKYWFKCVDMLSVRRY